MVRQVAIKDPGGAPGGVAPRRGPATPAAPETRFSISPADGSGEPIAILLVDDDPDCRMLIRDAISESKVSNRVFEVSNGAEAMDFLCRRGSYADAPKPGLIYLDIEMPG